MKAVVMAGGEGSRLRPLTLNRPKPMVPLVDRPVMGHIIELLKKHGITDIVVTVQYMANVIQDHFGDGSAFGVQLTYSLEDRPLGTAGSVKHAEAVLQEPFLVISGDAVTDIDLSQVIERHQQGGAIATMTLTRVPNPLEFGVAILDDQQRVVDLVEKPSWGEVFSDTVNTGIYVFDPQVFDYISTEHAVDWAKDVFPRLRHEGHHIAGCVVDGYWTDVGTIEEYVRATRDYLEGKVKLPRVGRRLFDDIWADG
jgi:mannose-1-phosphate guanylyltransferase/phosphomannomutase